MIGKRIHKLRQLLIRQKLDALLVLIEENRRYLSGFDGEDTQFDESAGALLVSNECLVLATDSRFVQQARRTAPLYRVVCYREGLARELPRLLKRYKIKRLGVECRRISLSQYREMVNEFDQSGYQAEMIETKDLIEKQRIKKRVAESNLMRKALRITEKAFEQTVYQLRPGMSEIEAAWILEKKLRESGAEGLSFPIIVASGPNSALPHAIPGDRCLKQGEPVLFDWGIRLNGYCSDISRTVVLGRPGKKFKTIYRTVRDAQKKAIDAIRPGVNAREVDAVARNHIEKNGFKGRFGHGLGHGVGLAVHEQPRLSPLSDTIIKAGMVFTVEPGIYLPGWGGIRIENMVRVRRGGVEVLNRLGTDLIRIEV